MFKQPRGFEVAFPASICDRLSFYGLISSIIILFITLFHKTSAEGYQFYGQLTSLGFITPVLGGVLADRCFGRITAVMLGLIYISIGNLICMSLNFHSLLLGLSFMMIGIGLFGPNNISFTGSLYEEFSAAKERGLTLLYLGMNIGAIAGPLLASVVLYFDQNGYRYFFLITALLPIIPLVLHYRTHLGVKEIKPQKTRFFLLTLVLVAIVYALFTNAKLFNVVFGLVLVGIGVYILLMLWKRGGAIRSRTIFILMLCFFNLFYLICSIQTDSALILFGKMYSNSALQVDIPVNWIGALEPLSILLLSPVMIWASKKWGHTKQANINLTLWKFFISLLASAAAYFLFYSGCVYFENSYAVVSLFVVGITLIGLGELVTTPPLLNAISNLIEERYQGFFLALTLVVVAVASYFGSLFAKAMVGNTTLGTHMADYPKFFLSLGIMALSVAILFVVLWVPLRRLAEA